MSARQVIEAEAVADGGKRPLAGLRADTFLETRRRIEAEERGEMVLSQARDIRARLLDAVLSRGFATLWGPPYAETIQQLRDNGFRVWKVTDVRLGERASTFHVTWDGAADFEFRPLFDAILQHDSDREQSSFEEERGQAPFGSPL